MKKLIILLTALICVSVSSYGVGVTYPEGSDNDTTVTIGYYYNNFEFEVIIRKYAVSDPYTLIDVQENHIPFDISSGIYPVANPRNMDFGIIPGQLPNGEYRWWLTFDHVSNTIDDNVGVCVYLGNGEYEYYSAEFGGIDYVIDIQYSSEGYHLYVINDSEAGLDWYRKYKQMLVPNVDYFDFLCTIPNSISTSTSSGDLSSTVDSLENVIVGLEGSISSIVDRLDVIEESVGVDPVSITINIGSEGSQVSVPYVDSDVDTRTIFVSVNDVEFAVTLSVSVSVIGLYSSTGVLIDSADVSDYVDFGEVTTGAYVVGAIE